MPSTTVAVTSTEVGLYAGITISGPVGQQYRIDYTTKLNEPVDWTPLSTITLSSSSMLFFDSTSPVSDQQKRYYRTVAIP